MTLEEKLTSAQTRISELEAQQADNQTANTQLQEQVAILQEQLAQKETATVQLQTDLDQIQSSFAAAQLEVEQLKAEAKTVETKAAEICASVGVEPQPVTPKGDADQITQEDLLDQLKAQKTPEEQTSFWRKNKDRILNRK
jgi:chromosome segregation ATPase